ncbi:MAG: hypothetical protein EPO07_06525, partial [Verrucomicrobia bacterium]
MKNFALPLAFLVAVICGCKHHPTEKEREYAAFLAGQRQAMAQVQEANRTSIRFTGNVQNHEIEWTNGLTLTHAIVAAQT